MLYIVIGLVLGALIYRQGVADGQKISRSATITNNPISVVKRHVEEKKHEDEFNEFEKGIAEMMGFKGGD